MIHNKILSIVKRIFKLSILLFIISFVLVEGLVFYGGKADALSDIDYIVVLGAGLKGENPSISLQTRMEKALEYARQNRYPKIIVSGGQGPNEAISEAEAMKRYFVRNGIDEDRIVKEDRSTSTFENIVFSKGVINRLKEKDDINVAIVTSNYHLFRAKYFAKKQGIKTYGIPAKAPSEVFIWYSSREYLTIMKAFILGL